MKPGRLVFTRASTSSSRLAGFAFGTADSLRRLGGITPQDHVAVVVQDAEARGLFIIEVQLGEIRPLGLRLRLFGWLFGHGASPFAVSMAGASRNSVPAGSLRHDPLDLGMLLIAPLVQPLLAGLASAVLCSGKPLHTLLAYADACEHALYGVTQGHARQPASRWPNRCAGLRVLPHNAQIRFAWHFVVLAIAPRGCGLNGSKVARRVGVLGSDG
jgi:hypothetical protein